MIQKLSHATVYVLNQDDALAFYRDKLGFEVRTDITMEGGFRWLTVGSKLQPDLQLVLLEPKVGQMFDTTAVEQMRSMIAKGLFGIGVFDTSDCRATYAELKAKGVKFLREPSDEFYGIEALVQDNSGNWFSLVQRKQ